MQVNHKQGDLQGFQPDLSPDLLRSGAVSFCLNLRASRNGWEKTEGYRETSLDVTNSKSFVMYWSPIIDDHRWFSASSVGLFVSSSGSTVDVSRAGGYTAGGEFKWSGSIFNGVPILNNEVDAPQFLSGSVQFKDLTGLTGVTFKDIVPFSYFLVGIAPNFGSGYLKDEVYWSSPADPGSIPPDWDYANPASDSGRNSLSSDGYLVTGKELNNFMVIYKSDSIWIMQYIGGQQIFSFVNKFPGQGAINKKCITSFEGKHFVVSQGDIIVHDGYNLQSIGNNRVSNYFFENINTDFVERIFVCKNPRTFDIFVFYPSKDSEDGICDRSIVWNWRDNIWHHVSVPNVYHAAYGYESASSSITWETYDTSWQRSDGWNDSGIVVNFAPTISYASKDYDHLLSNSNSGLLVDLPIKSIWEREDIVIGGISRDGVPYQDYDRQKTISQLRFSTDSIDQFDVYIGYKDNLHDSPQWEFAGTVDPVVDKRLDICFTTSLLSIRIETESPRFKLRELSIIYEFAGDIW